MFTEREIAYLRSRPLARLASVGEDRQPDIVPVGYELRDGVFIIGGRDPAGTRRHQFYLAGYTQVALVVDDLESVDPWRPRGLRVYGEVEVFEGEGRFGRGVYHHVTPQVSWSWGLEGPVFLDGRFVTHRTVHV